MRSKRTKATDIPQKVKEKVYKRDHGLCIICGRMGIPNSHYIKRSQGGLGIEENIVTMCLECHNAYDNGNDTKRTKYIKEETRRYLQNKYKDWNEKNLIYDKWRYLK